MTMHTLSQNESPIPCTTTNYNIYQMQALSLDFNLDRPFTDKMKGYSDSPLSAGRHRHGS